MVLPRENRLSFAGHLFSFCARRKKSRVRVCGHWGHSQENADTIHRPTQANLPTVVTNGVDCSGADYRLENDGACYRQGVIRPQCEKEFTGPSVSCSITTTILRPGCATIMPHAFVHRVHRARNATLCTALAQENQGEKPLD